MFINLDFYQDIKYFIDIGFKEISIESVVLPEENLFSIQKRIFGRCL
ncbi:MULTISPECIES: hypothetical protein [unclassified Clostridium]|nr:MULTISPECIES: hypothetical protein [unclassified Clostridium]